MRSEELAEYIIERVNKYLEAADPNYHPLGGPTIEAMAMAVADAINLEVWRLGAQVAMLEAQADRLDRRTMGLMKIGGSGLI